MNKLTRCLAPLLLIAALPCQDRAADLAARVDAYLGPLVAMDLFAGTVLLARGGEVLVEKAYGLADGAAGVRNSKDTRFKLMSVSKTFAGVAVTRLVQQQKVALTDLVSAHLPDWPAPWAAVTVHDLLDHTSGIPNLETEWSVQSRSGTARGLAVWRAFAARAGRPLQAQPGTEYRYSNFNTLLAGAMAEVITGKPWRELVRANVLEPAGMRDTGWDDGSRVPGLAVGCFRARDGAPEPSEQDMSHIEAAGGIWSTVGDLYRFDRALRGDALLDRATRERMVTPRAGNYACFWQNAPIHGHACIQHSGGANGYVADFLRFVDDDACVVVLSNYAFAPILRVSHDLAAILFDAEYGKPLATAPATLDGLAGVYRWPGAGMQTVVRRSGKALLAFDLIPGAERCGGRLLVPLGEATFAEAMGDARLVFARDGDGPVIRRVVDGKPTVLKRSDVPRADWLALAGEFGAEPALGTRTRLVHEQGALWLRIDGGWPLELEIVPVDAEKAMALYGGDGGTMLHRQGPRGDVLRWVRADGMQFMLVRR